MTLEEFLNDLASASPEPGGGSAAALSGALGASLVAMVCRLTIGRKNYEDVSAGCEKMVGRADELRAELLRQINEDAEAYGKVMAAYQLPKETEQEKAARTGAIQTALKGAVEVPLKVAQECDEILKMSEFVATKGNKNAASDGGAGALMASAGLRAALLNVEINLGLIQDEQFVSNTRDTIEPLRRGALKLQGILDTVQTRL